MKKVIIDKIDGYSYTLKDDNNIYQLNIEVYGLDFNLEVGDIIGINEKHLKGRVLAFGPLNEEYGKDILTNKDEIIVIIKGNKNYYLKRFYG